MEALNKKKNKEKIEITFCQCRKRIKGQKASIQILQGWAGWYPVYRVPAQKYLSTIYDASKTSSINLTMQQKANWMATGHNF